MNDKERLNRGPRVAEDIHALRRTGGIARELAESKIQGVASALARTLGERYSYSDLERAVGDLLAQYPSIKEEAEGSAQDRKAQEAERAANPTTAELAAMPAAKRLEVANELAAREREAQAAKDAKLDSEHTPDQLRGMSATARLSLANEWRKLGAEPEPKTPSAEQLRKMDAARRLDAVNRQIEASRKNASALGKRLAQARKDGANE